MSVRRAFVWASAGRYLVMLINLGATLILARLLAPEDYGVTVLGTAVFAVAEALRAVGGGTYLIQKAELTPRTVRACFTVSLCVTLGVAAILYLSSGILAAFFKVPHLALYIEVACLGYLTGPFAYPIAALMSRNLHFRALAKISVAVALANAAISVALALQGFGYLSFAWASAVSTALSMLLYLAYWRDRSVFKPLFAEWRSVLSFGLFDSACALIAQVADSLPYFIFGRLFNAASVGLAQRAVMLCMVPERVILAGVGAVALPAFSQAAREGRNLRHHYLHALSLITAALWPSLLLLALLAQPLVTVLLGAQWLAAIPMLQILAGALLFSFPITLHYAVVVSSGAIRRMPVILLLQSLLSLSLLYWAAHYSLTVAAVSTWLIFPCNCAVALGLARRLTGFTWAEVAASLYKSVAVTLFSAAGPALIVWAARGAPIALPAAALALGLSGAGWLIGLKWTRHPLLDELERVLRVARGSPVAMRFFGSPAP